jgi:hypothetical protein
MSTANVTIKVGPKAGMLIGSVRDSVTGKPVDKVRVIGWQQQTNTLAAQVADFDKPTLIGNAARSMALTAKAF